jgi:fucose permease
LGINATITSNVSNSSSAVLANDGEESRISIFYPILGGIVIISGLGLLAMEVHAIMTRRRKAKRNSGTDPKKEDTAKEQRTTVKIVVFVTLMCVFYFLYVGVEVVTGVYIASFAVLSDLKATQVQGAYVAAVFWGAFAAMRGVAIILAVYVDPLRTMLLSFSLCIGSGVALIFFAEHSFLTLAVLIAIMGCGMASIYATGLIWAEKYITVTNKIGSAFAMFAMAGPDVFPILMGSFIVETPMFLMYLILGTVSGCMGIFAFAAIVGRSILNDRRTERCENQDKVKVTALEVDLAK